MSICPGCLFDSADEVDIVDSLLSRDVVGTGCFGEYGRYDDSQKSAANSGCLRKLPEPGIGNTGTRCMDLASHPMCFLSNQPNISVGLNTTCGMPQAAIRVS